jgi:hypothetical protein
LAVVGALTVGGSAGVWALAHRAATIRSSPPRLLDSLVAKGRRQLLQGWSPLRALTLNVAQCTATASATGGTPHSRRVVRTASGARRQALQS